MMSEKAALEGGACAFGPSVLDTPFISATHQGGCARGLGRVGVWACGRVSVCIEASRH